MTSRRKARARNLRWARYMERISRASLRHHNYPFGLSVKTTPGNFGPRRVMRHRGLHYRAFRAALASYEALRDKEF